MSGPTPTTYRPFSSSFHEFGKAVYQQEELKIV